MFNILLIVTTIAATDLNGSNMQFNREHLGNYATLHDCQIAGDAITEQVFYKVPVDEAGQTKTMKVYTNQTYECVSRSSD